MTLKMVFNSIIEMTHSRFLVVLKLDEINEVDLNLCKEIVYKTKLQIIFRTWGIQKNVIKHKVSFMFKKS